MFERYTERAREVVRLAQEEARALNSTHILPGHILLGLFREREGLAARVLTSLGVDEGSIREMLGKGPDPPAAGQPMPFSPAGRRVVELSLREALSLGHNYIGTEHILLGLARDGLEISGDGRVFVLDDEAVRNETVRQLSGPGRVADKPDVVSLCRELAQKLGEVADALEEKAA